MGEVPLCKLYGNEPGGEGGIAPGSLQRQRALCQPCRNSRELQRYLDREKQTTPLGPPVWVLRVGGDDGELRP